MTKTITGLSAMVGFLLAAAFAASGAAETGVVHSGSGSALVHIVGAGPCAGQRRTVEFAVKQFADGTAQGETGIHVAKEQGIGPDICDGDAYHAELNCVRFFGNVAFASGPIVQTNEAAADFLGRTALFAAQDNGEGPDAEPDRILRVVPLPFPPYPATADCHYPAFTEAVVLQALATPGVGYAVEAGNVEIN
jgi:hypothetical protein